MIRYFALAFASLLLMVEARSEDVIGGGFAKLSIRATEQIPGLSWRAELVPIVLRLDKQGKKTAIAGVEGVFARPDATLLIRQTRVKLSPIGEFKLNIPLVGKTTQVQIVAMDGKGEVQSEVLELLTDWPGVQTRMTVQPGAKQFRFTPGVNFSFISYDQSNFSEQLSEKAVTFKAGISYQLRPASPFSLEAGGYYTLLVVSKNTSEALKFLGVNLRLGYALPFVTSPWSLSLQAGLYYTTTFVPGNSFGFANMAGPQLFPALRSEFANGNAAQVYFKISPVTTAEGKLFANREIAGGGAYVLKLGNGHPMPITLDISSLLLKTEGADISSSTVSLGFGYGF